MKSNIFVIQAALVFSSVLLIPVRASAAADRCPQLADSEIQGNVVLAENCTYQKPIKITSSHTNLDCKGAEFVGDGVQKIGLLIDSRGKELKDVTVTNCKFRNFSSSGIFISWSGITTEKGNDHAEIYRRTPKNVLLDRVVVEDSGKNGIYIDDYVTNVTLRDSVVKNSGSGAVYLEHSSHGNRIINNKFIGNGFRDDGIKREALSVDSSAKNEISNNIFQGNAAGGIFLYKNCGERIHSGTQVLRWQASDDNLISGNKFIDEKIGVWVASRQSKDLSKWDCGDSPMDKAGLYFQDYANNNTIKKNTFCNVDNPIRVEGDNTIIDGNQFDRKAKNPVEIPVSMRARLLGKPTMGTVVQNSKATDCRN